MKLKTNFSKESPVWLLGRCYHRKTTDSPCSDITELGTDVAAFQSQSDVGNFVVINYFCFCWCLRTVLMFISVSFTETHLKTLALL